MMKPRPYQVEAVNNTLDLLFNEQGANPVIAMPTGTGKGPVIGWTMRAIKQVLPKSRLINIAHVKELLVQNSSEMKRIWEDVDYGVYAAGLKSKDPSKDITYASIQSAVRNLGAFGKYNVGFIDEAHLLSPGETTNYQRLIKAFREVNPYMPWCGYSATPWRMKHGLLTEGNIFNCVAFDNTSREKFTALIDEGYLCQLIPKATSFQFDVSQVRILGGEFEKGDLQRTINRDELTLQALQESLQCAIQRKHILIYCAGIDHVESVWRMLTAMGEKAVYVHSRMLDKMRDINIAAFKGEEWAVKKLGFLPRFIISEGILTTGFNSPWVDCIIMLRPTNSPGLHVQILGRGTRPYYATGDWFDLDTLEGRLDAIASSEKINCMVLDFAGNTSRLGPINDPRVPKLKKKGGPGDVPVKICPCCSSYVHAAQRFCDGAHWDEGRCPKPTHEHSKGAPYCNHEFEFDTKLEQTASTVEIIVRDAPILHWFPVERVEYETYASRRSNAIPQMRVKYYSGIRRFTELVSVEHATYAGKIARDWWRTRLKIMGLGHIQPPPTTAKGMEFVTFLPKPQLIYVHLNPAGSKYENIIAHSFDGSKPTFEVKLHHGQVQTHGHSANQAAG